ncbi:MAG: hypothetical protein FWD17_02965, partial [Polyangiaceae bacterium]|nr:hypothetical protein [Polyangiaceae bacterium]
MSHAVSGALLLAIIVAVAPPARSMAPAPALRWTDETPDAMVDDATARALSPRSSTRGVMAALATIAALSDRAAAGHAQHAFERIAGQAQNADVRGEAALLARMLAPDETTDTGVLANEKLGIVDALAILGPFRDTGGGLDMHDGPEANRDGFGDAQARYSWGSYEVSWRIVPRPFAMSEGVPLDVF